MDKHKMSDLLDRYLRGECSPEEKHQVERWYSSYDRANLNSGISAPAELEQKLLDSIHRKIAYGKKQPFFSPYIWRAAAAVLALIVAFIFVFQNASRNPDFVVRSTAAGEHLKILLSDSSEVWLNASSSIRYPERFSQGERTIELVEGEAFFQVQRDEARPFTVTTSSGLYAKVLGTSFTVTSYRAEQEISVSVATGRVAVGNETSVLAQLSRDQQIVYDKETMGANLRAAADAHSWVRGELVLKGNTLVEAAAKIERYYGIRVLISESTLMNLKCTGKFDLLQKPEEIVAILCSLHDLDFATGNNTITINPKKHE